MHDYSEDALIEQPTIALFAALGWQTVNCFAETFGAEGTLGREHRGEVVLTRRLRPALRRLNPTAPDEAIERALAELTRDCSAQTLAAANRDLYQLIKDGVPVAVRDPQTGAESAIRVRVIDWDVPADNDFLLASQLWVAGEMYTRRADLVGFVNGLPLVFVELKAAHRRLETAYSANLRDYKDTIPQLFWHNALIILSNGSQSRIGSITAGWEHFAEWKKINAEGERGVIALDTMVRGTCAPPRLLDLVENFILFSDAGGSPVKILARNHQYLGVNNAIAALRALRENQGRLGVFWHTQGSGKSYSMIFFSQKAQRKIPGHWSFLIVTDRTELDDQIYKTFAACGAIAEPEKEVHAGSGAELQRLLREDHRTLFTLIQKFGTEKGATYPKLSDRSDIVVITDEAHRSQYDALAFNMRSALPNAAFIAFTGTPLLAGEEKTRQVFGEYVSVYNFRQAIEDGATVPLYYENRTPELQLTNPDLNREMEALVAAADLDEEQEKKLERELGRAYHLITRDERLDKVAEDIVAHFLARGEQGKALVVAIDKLTAVRMYEKVRALCQRRLDALRAQAGLAPSTLRYAPRGHRNMGAPGEDAGRAATSDAGPGSPAVDAAGTDEEPLGVWPFREALIRYMEATDMAVVISPAQNEIDDFRKHGLDITPHRRRMREEDLEAKFKNPDDPLRIVFVCAMWMTGFDVPSLSTIYLDKPMRNHTLMQTIARANRVFGTKHNGVIVDYLGIFRELQKALALYGSERDGGADSADGALPVRDKAELIAELEAKLREAQAFCREHGVDPAAIRAAPRGYERVALLDAAADALLANDATKKRYLALARDVARLYRAILPDTRAADFTPRAALFAVIAAKMLSYLPRPEIGDLMDQIALLLDESIAPKGYVIHDAPGQYMADRRIDLSAIDFEALKRLFAHNRRHVAVEELRTAIVDKLASLIQRNRLRMDYLARFQQLIDDYNAGSMNVEVLFDQLLALARELTAEEQRAIAESLSEEELAIFDLLTRPDPGLSAKERDAVKKAACDLLARLKHERLVLDWRKRQTTRAGVLTTIRDVLDAELPRAYTPDVYQQKCDAVYQHIYDAYADAEHSIYALAS